jgi:hypothetical protein
MPRTREKEGNKAQGIGIKKRGEGSFNKRGIDKVTNIKGICFNIDYKIRLINRT